MAAAKVKSAKSKQEAPLKVKAGAHYSVKNLRTGEQVQVTAVPPAAPKSAIPGKLKKGKADSFFPDQPVGAPVIPQAVNRGSEQGTVGASHFAAYDPTAMESIKEVKLPDGVGALEAFLPVDQTGLLKDFPELVAEDARLGSLISTFTERREQIKSDINARLLLIGQDKLLVGRYVASRYQGQPRLNFQKDKFAELSLQCGITAEVLEWIYGNGGLKRGKDPKPTVKVRDLVAGADDSGEDCGE